MSWQAYVDKQICEFVTCKLAIIASLADGSIWAKKEDSEIQVTQQELKVIADTMRNNNSKTFLEKGIWLGGDKYFGISVDKNSEYNVVIRGRKGSSALCIVSTKSCLLVVATTDGFTPGTLNQIVERLGDYLIAHNF